MYPTTPDDSFKTFAYEQFSRIAKALASPPRLVILNILCQGEHTVEAITKYSNQTTANVSRHLQLLKSTNLVKIRRQGKYIYYSLADDSTCAFFTSYRRFAVEKLPELKQALMSISESPSRLHPVAMADLKRLVSESHAVILDVRPIEEFEQGHIPNAISIPLDELATRYVELPEGRPVVVYCRGQFCILADKAVEILLSHGIDAQRADDGLVDWKLAGLPVV